MARNKTMFVLCLVVAAVAMAVPMAEAQLGVSGRRSGIINIQGIVFCSINGNATASTPVFPNAQVELQCGPQNQVISVTTTDNAGAFSILVDPIRALLLTLLSDCRLAVTTPLATCNASLPTVGGLLTSSLKLVGNTLLGLLNIITLSPAGFSPIN